MSTTLRVTFQMPEHSGPGQQEYQATGWCTDPDSGCLILFDQGLKAAEFARGIWLFVEMVHAPDQE